MAYSFWSGSVLHKLRFDNTSLCINAPYYDTIITNSHESRTRNADPFERRALKYCIACNLLRTCHSCTTSTITVCTVLSSATENTADNDTVKTTIATSYMLRPNTSF